MTAGRDTAESAEAEGGFDPPGRLRVDIARHKRKPGTRFPTQLRVEALEGMALPSVDVAATSVEVDLQLEMIGDQISAAGTLVAHWSGPCRRCVEPVEASVAIDVLEIFELAPVEGETYLRERDFADLRPMLTEAVALALPVVPLCRPDCVGPAPDRFPTVAVESAAASSGAEAGDRVDPDRPVDPRWAALSGLGTDATPADDTSDSSAD